MSCTKAPVGWYCTRKAGHDGPCAAVPAAAAISGTPAPIKTVFLTTIMPEDQMGFEFDKPTDIFVDEVFASIDAAKASFSDLSGYDQVKWVKKENIWEGTGLNTGFRIQDSGERESVKHILFIKEVPVRG